MPESEDKQLGPTPEPENELSEEELLEEEEKSPEQEETAEPEAKSETEPEVEQPPVTEPKPESRLRKTLRTVLRVALIVAIVVGMGALLAIFTLYVPERQRAAQSRQDLVQANQQVSNLEAQISDLEKQLQTQQDLYSTLETQYEELQAESGESELHVTILSVRTDVANARLALVQDDSSKSLLILKRTQNSLDQMDKLLEPDQRQRVENLRERLELILSEIETDAYAAESDLDVLEKMLLELENDYFAKP